jgi:hypothetical protein
MPTEISVWEQKVYEFGITLPLPPMPEPSADWGVPGLGLDLKATCPGAPFCGNPDADKNCSIGLKKPLKIPGFSFALPFPPEISVPAISFRIAFPPAVIIPGQCPNYPEQTAPPAGAGTG